MAGTDRSQPSVLGGPAIVLVEPQLAENIGAAARAMLNFGLDELRLVRPRNGWPNEKALSTASGADVVLERARLYGTLAEAVADLQVVYAMTARPRDVRKDVVTPAEAARALHEQGERGIACGILFGPERAGLYNDEIALADAIVNIPANPAFASLNLAQSVLVFGYEWYRQLSDRPSSARDFGRTGPATKADLMGLFEHLERELEASGFLYPPEKTPTMVRNLRAILQRAGLSDQEVRTLRGVVSALARRRA